MRKKIRRAKAKRDTDHLVKLIAALRTPGTGCIWSLQQSYETTVPFTLEEANELADAVAHRDPMGICDELGDLLYHVVFYARIAEERGEFSFDDVVKSATNKVLRRHPHVFGKAQAKTAEEVDRLWEAVKAEERAEKRKHALAVPLRASRVRKRKALSKPR